ncbi:MAG: hypothetical protein J5827_05195 [Oscillospiraceae bacterium]|nr:hypothetical protein [Oscillospiraceae bacterium]
MLSSSQQVSIGFRHVLDQLELLTPLGAELARHPKYYAPDESDLLASEQAGLRELMDAVTNDTASINALMRLLMPVKDIRRSIERCGVITPSEVELFEIKRFLLQLRLIAPAYSALGIKLDGVEIEELAPALDIIDPDGTRSPSFYVSDKHSPELARIRAERKLIDEKIRQAAFDPIASSGEEANALLAKRTLLAADEENENARLRSEIGAALAEFREPMLRSINSIGALDYILAKARLAVAAEAVIPKVGGESFRFERMRNPYFSAALASKGREFIPVSLKLVRGSTVITGANMGGKSMAIKTLALNAMLAMCGFAVFADEAELPMIDGIFLLSEDKEDSEAGLSSFGGEITAFDAMLRSTESMSSALVMLDEFARGTNPHEGAALVRAAAKLFNARESAFAVIATHFDGVAKLARLHYRVAGLANVSVEKLFADLSVDPGALAKHMDYGLYPVSPLEEPPRDAVTICKALGVSKEFEDLIEV